MKTVLLLLSIVLTVPAGFSQTPAPVTRPAGLTAAPSPRIANYKIDVTLDADHKTLSGHETLTWRNTSTDRISELQFHLYLNAFRDEKSTFMQESNGQLRGQQIDRSGKEDPYGSIDIVSMNVRGDQQTSPESLTQRIQFIHPDDKNRNDRTVIRVPLSRPVSPGQAVTVVINFKAKLPKIFARTGFSRDYFLVGQWFPKIGVYESAGTRYQSGTTGQWNCHQFHANSEFYADYGIYDVTTNTPQNYVTGATGRLVSEKANDNGTRTQHWHADDIVDFAWTASPRFEVVNSQWKGRGTPVNIRLLIQPEHRHQAQRHIDAAKTALAYFDKHLGAYPFPNLTIVDPPFHGAGSGGMEYPTFITAGTVSFLSDRLHLAEMTVVHEFGHQYFMQLLASNEFEQAWLDEGFNQYYEGRIMDATYGYQSSVIDWLGYRMGDLELSRDGYVHLFNPGAGPSFANVWQLPEGYYGPLTYFKTATWLRTLDGLVGRPVMDEIMQTYFSRWQWKHPCATDFIAIVNEIVPKRLGTRYGADMNWFFAQVLYGTQQCDYALQSVQNKKEGSRFRSTIRVARLGDMQLPVDVLVHFDTGKERMLHWDGKAGVNDFVLTQSASVTWAKVDPNQKVYIDKNLNNNSFSTEPDAAPAAKYAAKLMFWTQNWMQWLAWLV